MSVLEVAIPADGITLAGSLVTPPGEGPYPAALILAGSGPLDRDGNHKRLPLNVSRDLATVLEQAGWASLRFDKRGIGGSGGEYMPAGFFDELDDARSALGWLADREDTSTIVVIGHSVGASYAAEMSAFAPGVDGVVLLAYTAKTGGDTLVWQAKAISETLPGFITGGLRLFGSSVEKQQAKAIRRVQSTDDDVARIQGQKINAKWMREFIEYDPEPTLRATKTPMLAITGTKDVQVDFEDLELVAAVAGDRAEVHVVDDLDHILRNEPERVSNPKKYKRQLDKPIDPEVVELVTDWLGRLQAG
ncbi:MAG: alpha/beta fold hydrolase [Acidimicrobiia bacterium]|nr:alpha/beta fold hydrolase [Acidimicrobiia bacterium]